LVNLMFNEHGTKYCSYHVRNVRRFELLYDRCIIFF
jgi:hypothetical protein